MFNQIDTINRFLQAIRDAGIQIQSSSITGTGKIERFAINGDKRNEQSGWAVLHLDNVPAGSFGDWHTPGVKHTWCAVNDEDKARLAPHEQARINQLIAESERTRAKEQIRLEKLAAEKAVEMLVNATTVKTHPYLTAKKVAPYHAKIDDNGDLLISMQDKHGVITSLQRIRPNGEKRFLKNGKIKGCHHLFGRPDGITYIVEGWATGATVHSITGRPTVVAFNAGNLELVARAIRDKYPEALLVCAADNDAWKPEHGNTGLEAARKLESVGIPYLLPTFKKHDTHPTDFNDLYVLEGEKVTREQLTPPAGLKPSNELPVVTSELPEQHVALPDVRGEKSKPISTINNLREILRRLGVTVRYNVISKQEEYLIPNAVYSMDNKSNASLAWIESMCASYGMPTDKIGGFLTHIADENLYNPVATWIHSKPWDGVSRLNDFYKTVKIREEEFEDEVREYKHMILRRWCMSALAAAFRPNGTAAQGVLVFQGEQALGKTSWFKRLVPNDLRADGITLHTDDKDSMLQCLSYWMVELGELDATFRKSDIAQLKSFITKDRDEIRVAYAKRKSSFARRTVFFASVNSKEFLHDDTGNRRFWVLDCEEINYTHKIDIQQLWAELEVMYLAGERWLMSKDEMDLVNSYNQDFETIDPVEDFVMGRLDWSEPASLWKERTVSEILHEIGFNNPSRASAMKAATVIKKHNGGRYRKYNGKRLIAAPSKINGLF